MIVMVMVVMMKMVMATVFTTYAMSLSFLSLHSWERFVKRTCAADRAAAGAAGRSGPGSALLARLRTFADLFWPMILRCRGP